MSSTPLYSSKSYTHLYIKSFIVLLVLVFLPFVPSQPPEFVRQTICTTCWELIYLLVTGILLSYGLFSRRNVRFDNVTYSSSDISASYLSGISHVSSFFENGVTTTSTYVLGEKNMIKNRNFGERFDLDDFKNSRSLKLQNGADEKNVAHAWNSNFCVGDSMVFVANGTFKVESRNGSKPLNLPVRSLKSRIVDTASDYEDKKCVHSSNVKASDSVEKISKVNIRGSVPVNLDVKFRETAVSSPVRWGSRSERMDLKEDVDNVKPPFSSELKLVSLEVPARLTIPISTTVSQARLTSKINDFEKMESFRACSPSATVSSLAPLKTKTSSSKSSRQRSSSEVVVKKDTDNYLKDFGKSEKEDLLSIGTKGVVLLNSDVKPATIVKGKSTSCPFSEATLEENSKNDLKGLSKSQRKDEMCRQIKSIESSNSDVKHAHIVTIGPSSEKNYGKSSNNKLKDSNKNEKGEVLEKINEGAYEFWNFDLNAASLVTEQSTSLSSSEMIIKKNCKNVSMDFRDHKKEDILSREKKGIDSSKSDVKPETSVKGLTRGKSVRTIRSNVISVEHKRSESVYSNNIGNTEVENCNEDETGFLKNSDTGVGLESVADEHNKKNIHKLSNTKKSLLRKNRNRERQKNDSITLLKSENIFKEPENSQVIADEEENNSYIVGNTPSESDEVDKKATEFIAKFREQIRLQKVASMRESSSS